MSACPSCRAVLPQDARFCASCGAPLDAAAEAPGAGAEERRVVAALFCDLVGFTAICEGADPEDVDRLLREFYALSRDIIEQYGGTVEKFIGDAVVGVFGAPVAHEDDSERAVLAALRIRERLGEVAPIGHHPVRIRCGVNTGTSVVRLHVRSDSGEGLLVGDAVNTAARLQQAAPPDGIAVGDATRRLTERGFLYDHLDTVHSRASESRWRCGSCRSRISRPPASLDTVFDTPLVDRVEDLAGLRDAVIRARDTGLPQFVLLVGEAGIGKSRIIAEFARWLDRQPDVAARWRRDPACPTGPTSRIAR